MSEQQNAPGPWLIWSNEHEAWWNPNGCGYTTHTTAAGRYSFDEARKICDGACYRPWSQNKGTDVPPEVMVPAPEMLSVIESTPDLLAACKDMLEKIHRMYPNDWSGTKSAARAAIAKAEGKTEPADAR